MAEQNNNDKAIQVETGSKLYHWRYGSMTVKDSKGDYIILEIDDCNNIKTNEKLLDPWTSHLMERCKKFPKTAIDKWLFKVPEKVGCSKPSYGDRAYLSDEVFLRKLNTEFNEESVMECKNNYSQYLAKAKAEKLNKDKGASEENDNDISAKEIQELSKMKEEYIARKEEKEEEFTYVTGKLEDYENQISNLDANIIRCKRKISEKEKRIVIKENELDKIENEATTNVFSKNQGSIIDIESEIRRLEDGIDELRGEITEAGRNMEKISKEHAKLENKRILLNKEIQELIVKIQKMEKDLTVLT